MAWYMRLITQLAALHQHHFMKADQRNGLLAMWVCMLTKLQIPHHKLMALTPHSFSKLQGYHRARLDTMAWVSRTDLIL